MKQIFKKMHRAGFLGAQPLWARPTAAACISRIKVARDRRTRSWSVVIYVEDLLVKVVRSRCPSKDRINIRHGCGFKGCAGQHDISRGRQDEVHALCIKKEEQLILDDGATQRSRP